MRRYGLIFLGILLFTAGFSVLAWRVQTDPGMIMRYERALTGESDQVAPRDPSSEVPGDGGSGTFDYERLERKKVGSLKMIEIFIDLANVLVGLIGIGLAISGMRARGQERGA